MEIYINKLHILKKGKRSVKTLMITTPVKRQKK